MKTWMQKLAEWYLGIVAVGAIIYLVLAVPALTVFAILDLFRIGHLDEHDVDRLILPAIVLTIFLLVLKTTHETEQIKNHLANVESTLKGVETTLDNVQAGQS